MDDDSGEYGPGDVDVQREAEFARVMAAMDNDQEHMALFDALALLADVIDCWPEFGRDEPVSGSDLVDWFSGHRHQVLCLFQRLGIQPPQLKDVPPCP